MWKYKVFFGDYMLLRKFNGGYMRKTLWSFLTFIGVPEYPTIGGTSFFLHYWHTKCSIHTSRWLMTWTFDQAFPEWYFMARSLADLNQNSDQNECNRLMGRWLQLMLKLCSINTWHYVSHFKMFEIPWDSS